MASSYRTLNLDVLTVKTIFVKDYNNSNIPINTILTSDGRGGTRWRNPDFILTSTVSSISTIRNDLRHGLSTVYSPYGVSSLSSIMSYGLSSLIAGTINPGVSSLSSIVSYGLSSLVAGTINPGVSSLSSIISYGLSTVYSPYGVSSLSSVVSRGLSTVHSPYGVSSLSSIVSYGLSTVYAYALTLDSTDVLNTVKFGLSTVARNPIIHGVSSLSSIVSYGLSSVTRIHTSGVSSLSSIVSYGLSSFSFASVPFNTVMYGSGATTQFLNGVNNPSQINDLNNDVLLSYAYNSNIWVAGGILNASMPTGLMYSTNGINWNNCTISGTGHTQVLALNYTGSYFVGFVANINGGSLFRIYSLNGINWTRLNGNLLEYKVSIGYRSSPDRWVTVGITDEAGNPLTSIYTTNDFDSTVFGPISSGGFNISGANVRHHNNLWVAVGLNSNNTSLANVQFSGNGLNWSNASNVTLQSSSNILGSNSDGSAIYGGTSIAYANSLWYVAGAGGTTSNPIYTSVDGRNYTAIRTSDTSNINIFYDLEYDNVSRFYSIANIRNLQTYSGTYLITSSNNCSNWTVISSNTRVNQYQNGMAIGIISPPLQTKSLFTNNIYSDTVNASVLTGDGNGITNLNVSVLSNSLSRNITTLSNSLSCNITTFSNSLSCNITTLSNSLSCNITTLSNSLSCNITNVSNFFTAINIIPSYCNFIVTQNTRSFHANRSNGIIMSNLFSLNEVGKYLFHMKILIREEYENKSNAYPILYCAPSNYAIENNTATGQNIDYVKALYQINTNYRFHTMNDIITVPNPAYTSPQSGIGLYHLWYSEQNSNAGAYSATLQFSDITIQRIA